MPDFVVVNPVQQPRGIGVADRPETAGEITRKVQIGLFESQAKRGDVIDGIFHRRDTTPEETAHREFAEFDPALFHPVEVEPRVNLLVLECPQYPLTKHVLIEPMPSTHCAASPVVPTRLTVADVIPKNKSVTGSDGKKNLANWWDGSNA